MTKYDINKNGYRLPNGRVIVSSDDLTTEEIKELVEVNATAYDLLRLRTMQHELANAVSAHISSTELMFSDIKDMLQVDLSNGVNRASIPLGQAFKEMYDREKGHRNRLMLVDGVKRNKYFIISIVCLAIIITSYHYDNNWFLTALIPFFISLLKDLIKK